MLHLSHVIKLGSLLFLVSCSSPSSALQAEKPAQPVPASPSPIALPSGQVLPIGARAQIAGQVIELEVTRTPQEQMMGLMYRTSLPDDRGMLFEFNPPQPVRFWMKNCKMSLDMIFLKNGIVKAIAAEAPPCTSEPCPTYGPDLSTPIDQVIELRGGRAAELGLKPGDRIPVEFLTPTPSPQPSP